MDGEYDYYASDEEEECITTDDERTHDEYYEDDEEEQEEEYIITEDEHDHTIELPDEEEQEERTHDEVDVGQECIFFDCPSLLWLWNHSQWRALPNHMRVAFLKVIHEVEEQMRPHLFCVMNVKNTQSYFRLVYKVVDVDFTHWLVNDYLVNMDYYDPFVLLREDFETKDENYISTARTLYAEQHPAETVTEEYEENPFKDKEVDGVIHE